MIFSDVGNIFINLFLKQKRCVFSYKIKPNKGILNKISVSALYIYHKIFQIYQKFIFSFDSQSNFSFLFVSQK